MRNILKWGALLAIPVVLALATGLPSVAHAAVPHVHSMLTLGAPLVFMIGRTAVEDLPLGASGVTLETKNRAATELRGKAKALRESLLDTSKPMTTEEVNRTMDDIRSIEARANVIAEFTADAETQRQGGTGPLVRTDNPNETGVKLETRTGKLADRIAEFATRVQKQFGDVRNFMDIAVAGRRTPETDDQRKLIAEARVLTRAIVGTAGDVSGGEFVLPLTQVPTIFSMANVQQGIMQRARTYNVPGRTLRIPYLIQDDTNASTTNNRPMAGNIANVGIVGEGSNKPPLTPLFGQRLLTAYKYAAITQASDEILGDDFTGELPAEFINAVGQQALNKINEDVTIDAAGSGEPLGAFNAGTHNISQARQTSNTITPVDVFAMYSKLTHGPNACWFASRRCVQALYNMSLTSASLVTFLKDLSGTPQMMLLGYPIVLTDLLPTLGQTADFCLANPDFYAFALRQALTVEQSRDYAFIADLTTYRFVVRAGGIPINTGKYAYKYVGSAGVDEHAPFVYLHS